ncbi:ribosome modulation factor, partial [Escherichia coli]|nr:ribosome modulation factor [Escherichia coli]
MKRQKQDHWNRGIIKKWLSGRHRRTLKKNVPYQTLNQRSQWLGGWREAMAD